MKITVIGLGKIGLPLAAKFASKGHKVLGVDIDISVVDSVNCGTADIPGEKGLSQLIQRAQSQLSATSSTEEAVSFSDVVLVMVPLSVNNAGDPDFEVIDSVTDKIGKSIKRGTLVLYETTLPVGTTRTRFAPRLSTLSGFELGIDLFVAFSPERVSSGTVLRDLSQYPKLVGGVDLASGIKATHFYTRVLDFQKRKDLSKANGVWNLGNSDTSEFAKLAETTYRDVNIGLANEFAKQAEDVGVDLETVIEACNSQPYSRIHNPGISVGGHCIPVYPHLYMSGDKDSRIVRVAREVNEAVPERLLTIASKTIGNLHGMRIAVLGLAYRPGVKEHAFSGAIALAELASNLGASTFVHDPLYSNAELSSLGLSPYSLGQVCDLVILHTAHIEYQGITPEDFPGAKLFIDGRNAAPKPILAGIPTFTIGKGM